MARSGKRHWWRLLLALTLLVLATEYLVAARAAAGHNLVFVPDRIGGLGDIWMWPGQAYFFSGLCTIGAVWLIFCFLRPRAP